MPGRSDAAWLAAFGARRLMSHLKAGDNPRASLRHALADAERSFAGLRRRPPQAPHELPLASMMLAVPQDGGFDALWYGDCAALVQRPGAPVEIVGAAIERRAGEETAAQRFIAETGQDPVTALQHAEAIRLFRAGRANVNTPAGEWLFSPMAAASEHVGRARIAAPAGSLVLLCTDGFLALASNYRALAVGALVDAACHRGLADLAAELRRIEEEDATGRRFPRFKKSDDATAVLVKLV